MWCRQGCFLGNKFDVIELAYLLNSAVLNKAEKEESSWQERGQAISIW
jgi:hypothetical protein